MPKLKLDPVLRAFERGSAKLTSLNEVIGTHELSLQTARAKAIDSISSGVVFEQIPGGDVAKTTYLAKYSCWQRYSWEAEPINPE